MVKEMATKKPKSAAKPVAKKKAAKPAKKAQPAKKAKPVARKPAPKPPARKPVKAAKAKPAKAAKKISAPKPAAGAKPASKPVANKLAAKAPAKSGSTPKLTNTKGKMSAVVEKDSITREDGRYALPSTTVIDLPANYRQNPREEYMGPKHLAYFRGKLQKWREDLVEESKQTIDNLRDEVRDVGDEAERATRETENSLELRTRDRYRKLIGKIDKALKRIEEGRYGFCEETDEEIGIERLEARPIATLCLDAQERWEHRQKQMGD
jgi:DnaK suppressor protein